MLDQSRCLETQETVAIKKVLKDRRYKDRELELISFEAWHIHTVPGVCQRDVKPQNVLVNPVTHQVKICDFGRAKILVRGEANISYICSRYYQAPELMFDATEYTTSIDIWSAGCILAEILLGQPLFRGENTVDQLSEIIQVKRGRPTRMRILGIRCAISGIAFLFLSEKFPRLVEGTKKVFGYFPHMPPEAIDLTSRLLQYAPSLRCTALEACADPFFDELREPNPRLPNGRPLPPIFNFRDQLSSASPELILRLIPEHLQRSNGLNFTHHAAPHQS
ncbi:hypothetical protein MLD38_025888 [Melastoma candidum]|uniref:Uncharacterized protein n=1 Tax=Melastoma candidum TaxID=119954 RepID=A0ACB9NWI6_9MYRT|nr:hypothetical protein MLD38_025888 [Melastoma candidum]